MENTSIRRVYVWQTPVRFYHWLNAIVVFALAITGYIIGSPPAIQSSSEASFGYWFGTVRFIQRFFSFSISCLEFIGALPVMIMQNGTTSL